MLAKSKLIHVVGWVLIAGGIGLWIAGIWYGPGLFVVGLVVETIGYVVARCWEVGQEKQSNKEQSRSE